jgi:hypothetical protein
MNGLIHSVQVKVGHRVLINSLRFPAVGLLCITHTDKLSSSVNSLPSEDVSSKVRTMEMSMFLFFGNPEGWRGKCAQVFGNYFNVFRPPRRLANDSQLVARSCAK